MDKFRKKIPEALNKTVLKDIDFNKENKEYVRRMIHNQKKNRLQIKNTFNNLLPIAATLFIFLGVVFYISTNQDMFSLKEPLQNFSDDTGINPQQTLPESTLYSPPLQQEVSENLTKEDVVQKLLNTVDYFHTAAGSFEEYVLFYDDSESTTMVEFELSIKNKIGGYEKLVNLMDENIMGYSQIVKEYVYNHEKIWTLYDKDKTYLENTYEPQSERTPTTIEDAFSIDLDVLYEENKVFRERPIGASGMSLFPYEKVSSYLRNMQLWEIENQNEVLLGHNTIVLFGKMDEQVIAKTKMKATTDTFRFWVDKDTGILIKYETYDVNGKLTSYLHPDRLDINIPVDLNTFIPNLEGYNKKRFR